MTNSIRLWFQEIPKGVWIAIGVGALLRVWIYSHYPYFPSPDHGDYAQMAQNLINTGSLGVTPGVPSAWRLPGFPLIIAAVFWVLRDTNNLLPVLILNLSFTVAATILIYRIGARVATKRIGLAAAWLTAINPAVLQLNYDHGIESVFLLMMTLLAYSLVHLAENPESPRAWAATGVVVGMGLMIRSTMVIFPMCLFFLMWLTFRPRPHLKFAAIVCATTYIFVAPWMMRNYLQFGRIIPFEDGSSWHAVYQGSNGVYGITPDENLPEPMRTYFFERDPKIGPYSKEIALRNIKADPLQYLGYCVGRLKPLWFSAGWAEVLFGATDALSTYRSRGDWLNMGIKLLMKSLELAFMLLMLLGIVSTLMSPPLMLLSSVMLYMNIHVFTMGIPRYTAPVVGIMSLFCALGFSEILSRLGQRQTK
ncbi:MAG: hypothetical protein COB53_04005 [Elusimicrobia bacterium]|nr:MAG: hypothetical protein COB53_04005 [Elusimicrobiota bacterium]